MANAFPGLSEEGNPGMEEFEFGETGWAEGECQEGLYRASARGEERIPQGKALQVNVELYLHKASRLRRAYVREGSAALRGEYLMRAEGMYRRAIRVAPRDWRAYLGLGKVLEEKGRSQEADETYEEGLAVREGDNARLWAARGDLARGRGRRDVAEKMYKAALAANRSSASAWEGLTELERSRGSPERPMTLAQEGWREAASEDGKGKMAYLAGLCRKAQGRVGLARQAFRSAARAGEGDRNHAMWHSWAELEWQGGNIQAAFGLLRRGLGCNPKSPYLWHSWALWEGELGRWERAELILERCTRINPDQAVYTSLGRLRASRGDLQGARNALERASRKEPGNERVYLTWARSELEAGEPSSARQVYSQGAQACSGAGLARLFLGWAELERMEGNVREARALLRGAVRQDPSSDENWWGLEEELSNLEQAARIRRAAMEARQDVVQPQRLGFVDQVIRSVRGALGDEHQLGEAEGERSFSADEPWS